MPTNDFQDCIELSFFIYFCAKLLFNPKPNSFKIEKILLKKILPVAISNTQHLGLGSYKLKRWLQGRPIDTGALTNINNLAGNLFK